jgi:flagellar motor protein MotB
VILLAVVAAVVVLLRPAPADSTAPPYRMNAVLIGSVRDAGVGKHATETVLSFARASKEHLMVGPLMQRAEATLVDLAPSGTYDVERADNLADAVRRVHDREAGLLAAARGGAGHVLAGLYALGERLAALPPTTPDVVLVGDLQSVGGGVDLRDPVQRADPEQAVRTLSTNGLLPPCRGWRVSVVGGIQDDLVRSDPTSSLQIREFWRRFFAQCGGRLVTWDATQLVSYPPSGDVPASDARTPCTITITIGSDVLFAVGRAEIPDAAAPLMRRLADTLVRVHPGSRAHIVGFTDATGEGRYDNVGLSRRRAAAVRDDLVAAGVPGYRLSSEGRGAAQPIGDNSSESGRRINRRVEITVTLAPQDCQSSQSDATA